MSGAASERKGRLRRSNVLFRVFLYSVIAFVALYLLSRHSVLSQFWTFDAIHVLDSQELQDALIALEQLSKRYSVLTEKVMYSRFARVYSRTVQHSNGDTFEYDVWGRNWKNESFTVVCVVPYNPRTRAFTLIREYNVAHNKHVYSFPQGCYEKSKHASPMDAALAELEEEARVSCGISHMIPLLDTPHGSPQDKYQREAVHYFLCKDVIRLSNNSLRSRDAEESIEVTEHVPVSLLKGLIRAGVMQSNNIAAGLLAIDRLRQDGLLPKQV